MIRRLPLARELHDVKVAHALMVKQRAEEDRVKMSHEFLKDLKASFGYYQAEFDIINEVYL
jgi:hypothetical protein